MFFKHLPFHAPSFAILCLALASCTTVSEEPRVILGPNQILVRSSDTLYGIAAKHDVSVKRLMDINHLSTSVIHPGQVLIIPEKDGNHESSLPPSPGSESDIQKEELTPLAPSIPAPGAPGLITIDPSLASEIAQEQAGATPASAVLPSATPTPQTPPALLAASTFSWPVKGDVVKKFGEMKGNFAVGISIAAPKGAAVKAAREGTVFLSSPDVGDYGKLIIVKHPDSSVTAYGYLDTIAVAKGDKVTQGMSLGTVGIPKGAQKPQLYFELRQPPKTPGSKPKAVNPLPLLGG